MHIMMPMPTKNVKTYQLTTLDIILKLPRDLLFPTLCTGFALFCWYKLDWDCIFGIIYIFIICFGLYQYYVVYTHWHHSKNMVIIYNETTNEVTYRNRDDTFSFFLADVAILETITPNRFGYHYARYFGWLDSYILTINRVHRTLSISSLLSIDEIIDKLNKQESCRCITNYTYFCHIEA